MAFWNFKVLCFRGSILKFGSYLCRTEQNIKYILQLKISSPFFSCFSGPEKEKALIWESLSWCLYQLRNELSHPLRPSQACHLKEMLNRLIDPKAALSLFSALHCFWVVTWSFLASHVLYSLRSSWLCLPHSGKWKHQRNVWVVPGGKAEPHFQLWRCLLSQSELQQLFSSLLLSYMTYSSNCLLECS